MQVVNLKTLCIYFAPLVHISTKIGPGTTALLLSNLESVTELSLIKHHSTTTVTEQSINNRDRRSDIPPDSIAISRAISSIYGKIEKQFKKNKAKAEAIMTSSSSFSRLIIENPSGNVWLSTGRSFDEHGYRLDKFGIYLYFRNIYYNFGKNHIFDGKSLKIFNINRDTESKFELAFRKFKSTNTLDENEKDQINSVIKYFCDLWGKKEIDEKSDEIVGPWKEDIKEYREMNSERINKAASLEQANGGYHTFSPVQKTFIDFLDNENKIKNKQLGSTSNGAARNSTGPAELAIPSVAESQINLWIESNNITALSAHLTAIDNHPKSAKSLKKDNPYFIYGSERAEYPKDLIKTIIQKRKIDILKKVGKDHLDGAISLMSIGSKDIFQAFHEINPTKPDKEYLAALLEAGFKPNKIQKKYLIEKAISADIDSSEDLETTLFELLCEKGLVDFNKYIEDRGVTPFHLLLFKGKSDLVEHVRVKYINIIDPNLKIKFVPLTDEKSLQVTPYWNVTQDQIPSTLSNMNSSSALKVRKNWTPLMLAAATNNIRLFSDLLSRGADGTGMAKILQFLNHSLAFWNEMKQFPEKFPDFKNDDINFF